MNNILQFKSVEEVLKELNNRDEAVKIAAIKFLGEKIGDQKDERTLHLHLAIFAFGSNFLGYRNREAFNEAVNEVVKDTLKRLAAKNIESLLSFLRGGWEEALQQLRASQLSEFKMAPIKHSFEIDTDTACAAIIDVLPTPVLTIEILEALISLLKSKVAEYVKGKVIVKLEEYSISLDSAKEIYEKIKGSYQMKQDQRLELISMLQSKTSKPGFLSIKECFLEIDKKSKEPLSEKIYARIVSALENYLDREEMLLRAEKLSFLPEMRLIKLLRKAQSPSASYVISAVTKNLASGLKAGIFIGSILFIIGVLVEIFVLKQKYRLVEFLIVEFFPAFLIITGIYLIVSARRRLSILRRY